MKNLFSCLETDNNKVNKELTRRKCKGEQHVPPPRKNRLFQDSLYRKRETIMLKSFVKEGGELRFLFVECF